MSTISVRFQTGSKFHNKVFYQPLYYLSENIRQRFYKINHKSEYNAAKLDDKLDFQLMKCSNDVVKLEMACVDDWNNIKLVYIMNRYNNNINFKYNEKDFSLKVIEINLGNTIINEMERDNYNIFSAYEITYNSDDIDVFEELIKKSINYYEKYYCNDMDSDENSIQVYITASECSYFQYLGKRNKRDIESIYLPKAQKDDIVQDLEKFIHPDTKKRYNKLGINYKRIYLLEGLPGTGKTSLITGLASKFNYSISIINFIPKMTDVDLLRSIKSLKLFEEEDKKHKKSFLVFEDIDCIFKERKANDEHRNNITFSGLLNALDGITTTDIICFITTNYKHNLDSALLRPGRIDYIMRFDYAIKEQIVNIFRDFTSETNNDVIQEFYETCTRLTNTKFTTALLQQYLLKYIDKPREAIDNLDEMKQMFTAADTSKDAEATGLYS
jgi:AAA+ superfamily predicted ATPase